MGHPVYRQVSAIAITSYHSSLHVYSARMDVADTAAGLQANNSSGV